MSLPPEERSAPPPIRPVPVSIAGIELPLSFAQERLWFLDRLQPGTSLYNLPLAFLVRGPLDISALAGTLSEIVCRHSALRTRFRLAEGQPVQSVAPAPDLALPLADLCALPHEAREREARRLAAAFGARPFRLDRDLLLRCLLVRVGEREHAAAITLHYTAADGGSVDIFLRELGALYRSRLRGLPSPLSEPALQYVDFAVWQRGYWAGEWAGERLEAELAHWRAALDGVRALELPTDRPRPAVLTSRGSLQRALLPRELGDAALALGRAEGATLFMVLLAALAAVLSRHAGQDDLTVGTPIANRNRVELEGLIGLFVNLLVLRADCTGEPSFRDLLARVRRTVLDACAHQDLPFAKLVEALQPERSLARTPLFQVLFALEDSGREAPDLPGLTLIPFGEEGGNAEFELSVTAVPTPEGIVLALTHNVDLFDGATALRLAGHLRSLLEAAVADPGRRLSELPLLGPAERHQLLREMDPGPAPALVPSSSGRCLHELFEEHAARTPAALAVIDVGGDGSGEAARLTYAQLDLQATALARRLRALGARLEGPVGVCLDRSPELLVALLAVWKAGGAYLPLDPAYPGERLELMLRDAGASLVLTRSGLAAGLPAGAARRLLVDDPGALAAPEGLHERGEGIDPAPLPAVSPQNLAYVIYTSGSTGRPKGVAVSHAAAAVHFAATAAVWELGPGDRSLVLASPSFDASLDEMVPALLAGACVAVGGTDLWQPAPLLRAARRFGLTVVNLATAVWNSWMHDARELDLPPGCPLRLVVVGGEAMSPAAARQWWRSPLAAMELLNTYGPTETVVTATMLIIGRREAEAATGAVAIGRPCSGRHAVVLDRRGLPVPAGVPGELCLGGAALARGYLGLPAATAERFVPDPFAPEGAGDAPGARLADLNDALGARLYRTGDLVRRRVDGVLEFLGRIDQQVKIRGFRIEPGEVAAALAAHPAVAEAAVEVVDGRDGGRRLAAFAVLRANARFVPRPRDLRAYLEARLPAFLVPASFVLLAKLPLTPNDKLDRRALARLAMRAVDVGGEEADRRGPRDDLERRLARIWEELLEVPAVGVHDSFFDLGGHSLLAVRLISRIARELGRELPLAAVFQAPTLERLATLLRA